MRFDTDLGKHGDTGDSELRVRRGRCPTATPTRARSATPPGPACARDGHPAVGELEIVWRSPTYYHCNFTALPSLDEARAAAWSEALLAMSYDEPIAPASDGSRGRQALASGRQGRLCRPRGGDARQGLPRVSVRRCETGTLELGGGLEVLVSAALDTLRPGDELDVVTESRSVAYELSAWARVTGHEVVDERRERADGEQRFVARLRRGQVVRVLGDTVSGGYDLPALPTAASTPASSAASPARPQPTPTRQPGLSRSAQLAEPGAPDYRLAAQQARLALVGQARQSLRPRRPRPVGRHHRHPLGSRTRTQAGSRASSRSGNDLHRPERVRRVLRSRALPRPASTRATSSC